MNKVASFFLVAVLSLALPASALTIGGSSNASSSIRMEDGVDVGIESETRLESNMNAEAAAGDTDADGRAEVQFEVNATGPTVIVRSDILEDTSVSVKSSTEVDSKAKLDAYAKGVVKASADIRDVVLSENEVSVSHRENARVFGILPVKVFARATIASDGSVKVKFPWYCFAAQKKAAIESKVKAAVKSSIPSVSTSAEAQAKLSSQAQAQVLEKTVAAMKSEFSADAAASANVN